jgi:predicted Zn-dependent protease
MKQVILKTALCASVIVTVLTACTTNPVTGRKELNMVSGDEETKLGLTSFDQMKKEVPVSKDPTANAMVQRVGKKIAAIAGKDMPNAQWEFVVFDSKEANAFCLPGGKVGVYTGLLPIAKDDSGLATVLGHEIGHAVSHHGAERMSQAQLLQVGGQAVGALTSNSSQITQTAVAAVYGLGGKLGYELPHSRAQESEADKIGLIYMTRAGYAPEQALAFWQRFAAYNNANGGSKTPGFLSTHPLDEVRIKQIQEWIPEVKAQSSGSTLGSQVIGK